MTSSRLSLANSAVKTPILIGHLRFGRLGRLRPAFAGGRRCRDRVKSVELRGQSSGGGVVRLTKKKKKGRSEILKLEWRVVWKMTNGYNPPKAKSNSAKG